MRWTDWAARIACGIFIGLCFIGAAGAASHHDLFWTLFELLAALIWLYNLRNILRWPAQRAEDALLVQQSQSRLAAPGYDQYFSGIRPPVAVDIYLSGVSSPEAEPAPTYTRPPLPRPANRVEEEIRRRLASGDGA